MQSTPAHRKHQRIAVRIPVAIRVKSRPGVRFEAEILDMSLGGAFVHCTAPVAVGEQVTLEIDMTTPQSSQQVHGQVITLEQTTTPPPVEEAVVVKWARGSSNSGFGVEFSSLSDANRTALERLLRYFEQLASCGVKLE